jgi:hypothetical protein
MTGRGELMKTTMRDLFWIVALAAVLAGWFADHRRLATQVKREAFYQQWHTEQLAIVLLDRIGAKVTVTDDGIIVRYPNGNTEGYPKPAHAYRAGMTFGGTLFLPQSFAMPSSRS